MGDVDEDVAERFATKRPDVEDSYAVAAARVAAKSCPADFADESFPSSYGARLLQKLAQEVGVLVVYGVAQRPKMTQKGMITVLVELLLASFATQCGLVSALTCDTTHAKAPLRSSTKLPVVQKHPWQRGAGGKG